jgi:hypothetical protein
MNDVKILGDLYVKTTIENVRLDNKVYKMDKCLRHVLNILKADKGVSKKTLTEVQSIIVNVLTEKD